jgi:hypothetical protein
LIFVGRLLLALLGLRCFLDQNPYRRAGELLIALMGLASFLPTEGNWLARRLTSPRKNGIV